jgi:hypothetical protein
VHTDRSPRVSRILLIVASLVLIAVGGVTVLRFAHGSPSAAQEPAVPTSTGPALPTVSAPSTATAPASTTSTSAARPAKPRPGVPVAIDIPLASTNHPAGLHARITAHPLNADGTLYVPADPKQVAWASQDAMPGSDRGTAILVSHVNYVINGRTVAGAFADLAEYIDRAVGRTLTLTLSDGRTLRYRITGGHEYAKDDLAGNPQLRKVLYNQTLTYGPADRPSGRLLLVSCGGPFDPVSGEYQDNVFVYALPIS